MTEWASTTKGTMNFPVVRTAYVTQYSTSVCRRIAGQSVVLFTDILIIRTTSYKRINDSHPLPLRHVAINPDALIIEEFE